MPSLECSNPFKVRNHKRRRESLRPVTERLKKQWGSIVQLSESLCETCFRYCYSKNPNDFTSKLKFVENSSEKNGQVGGSVDYINQDDQSSSGIGANVEFETHCGSENGEVCDVGSDDEYFMDKSDSKQIILPLLNSVLDFFKIEKITSLDLETLRIVEGKIDSLANNLKRLLLNNYCSVKSTQESFIEKKGFFEELKGAFQRADSNSEKIHILTAIPLSCSAYEVEREINCSIYLAREAQILREKQGILSYPAPKTRSSVINGRIKEEALSFFLQDDISRPCPGMCEATIVRGGAIKKNEASKTLNYVQFERSLCFVSKTLFRTWTSISTWIYLLLFIAT